MIVTFTPNPSIDLTLGLDTPLRRGEVQRLSTVSRAAGGKGINVAGAIHQAECPSLAIFPSPTDDPFIRLLSRTGVDFEHIHNEGAVRTNTTVMELDGTTTKLNGPGAPLTTMARKQCERRVADYAQNASWIVLAGSLPPDAPENWYSELIRIARAANPNVQVAVDTSDAPLLTLASNLEDSAPTLLKPNGFELGILADVDGAELERQAASGDYGAICAAAESLNAKGVRYVLVTLGGAGAVLSTPDGTWAATPYKTDILSTVGAGDCSLAGFLLGREQGLDLAHCLQLAVAYGTAAATLPGTQIPTPDIIKPALVTYSQLA